MDKRQYQVIVIGGGASGMAAAIAALEEGRLRGAGKERGSVLLLESNDRVGKKILATGNGKCNFTHENVSAEHYNTDDRAVLKSVLAGFSTEDALCFFEKMGMLSREKNGYFYPLSETASTVLDVLQVRLSELGCDILCGVCVERIEKNKEGFLIGFREQERLREASCGSIILATGSKAGGFLQNREEDPLRLAKSLGLHSTALYPALTKCICREEHYYRQLAGVRAQVKLALYAEDDPGKKTGGRAINGLAERQNHKNKSCAKEPMSGKPDEKTEKCGLKLLKQENGELQLTKDGISGIAVFQLSGTIAQKLSEKKRVIVEINFLPGFREDTLKDWAKRRLSLLPGRTLEEFFLGVLHKKVLGVCLQAEGFSGTMKLPVADDHAGPDSMKAGSGTGCAIRGDCAENRAVTMVMSVMKRAMHFATEVTAVSDMRQAQVCRGGLSLSQFTGKLECKKIPGLFACGEVLNVDGECGGYNLHFAWGSGVLAGREAMRKCRK